MSRSSCLGSMVIADPCASFHQPYWFPPLITLVKRSDRCPEERIFSDKPSCFVEQITMRPILKACVDVGAFITTFIFVAALITTFVFIAALITTFVFIAALI